MPRASLVSVVEDDPFFRQSMRRLMRSLGYPVEVFSSAADFLASPRSLETTCLISDVQMPVMNGLEAASHITKKEPTIPVILFSLHLSDDLSRHFDTGGIRGAVAKGNAARDLVLAIETVLAGGTFFPGQKSGSN